jgi:subtilisin family serine protease
MMRFTPRVICAVVVATVWPVSIAPSMSSAGGPAGPIQVIIKLDESVGARIDDITAEYGLRVERDVLASRGIYLVAPADGRPFGGKEIKSAKALAEQLAKDHRLTYAEQNYATDASDDRFHAWPQGSPVYVGTSPALWSNQQAIELLQLDDAHKLTKGRGAVVAVLDTGIDRRHPAFAGRLGSAWDYVDDDADPTDVADRIDNDADAAIDEAFGHGTHVAGIVAMVAPLATILPARVLDADGHGNVFTVAAAIDDVVADGATVINLSFGTRDNVESAVLKDTIDRAVEAGVVVVASAGNDSSGTKRFPGSHKAVLAIAGADESETRLATFSNRGKWVDASAPSCEITSPVPGGGYATWSGTSMAAPFVAGQAALLDAFSPESSAKQIRNLIKQSARRLSNGSKDDPALVDILGSLESLD